MLDQGFILTFHKESDSECENEAIIQCIDGSHRVEIDDLAFFVDVKKRQPFYKDDPIYHEVPFMVGGIRIIMIPRQVFQKRKPHPKGYICMNCRYWSRDMGKEELKTQTHNYSNGSFSKVEEIVKALSSRNNLPALTAYNCGYCPKRDGGTLCPETSSACDEYDGRPWLARVRNWWRRSTS